MRKVSSDYGHGHGNQATGTGGGSEVGETNRIRTDNKSRTRDGTHANLPFAPAPLRRCQIRYKRATADPCHHCLYSTIKAIVIEKYACMRGTHLKGDVEGFLKGFFALVGLSVLLHVRHHRHLEALGHAHVLIGGEESRLLRYKLPRLLRHQTHRATKGKKSKGGNDRKHEIMTSALVHTRTMEASTGDFFLIMEKLAKRIRPGTTTNNGSKKLSISRSPARG